jgi:hypothetical protein
MLQSSPIENGMWGAAGTSAGACSCLARMRAHKGYSEYKASLCGAHNTLLFQATDGRNSLKTEELPPAQMQSNRGDAWK